MKNIKFLHLSDLHLGDKYQKGLISQTKKVLFEDIEFILSEIKTLDIVFFTGDFVQKGTKEEFELLEEFLIDLWKLFENHNQNPYIICVPGNHDLERINDINNPIQKVMTNWITENIKDEYFWNSPNAYHSFIKDRFKNYENWYNNTTIKKPSNIQTGYLPGDFYCSININDIKMGIVGLNSTFLQLYNGDVKGKLGVYNNQISLMFGEKYFEWLKEQELPILLTHHSPEWYEPKAINNFDNEIYTNDTYLENLCGHMHEPSYTSTSINGFQSKRIIVSPSLFGLEYYDDKLERIHGYTAGSYNIDSGKITKTIWPRISHPTKKNGLKISQNEEFNLDKKTFSFTETLKNAPTIVKDNDLNDKPEKISAIGKKGGNLFAKEAILDKGLARTVYNENYSHLNIRFQERNETVNSLKIKNYCWIVTSFGLGEDKFIGSILNEANINSENCFSINCDEVNNIEDLINEFKNTFSQDITQFFDIINSLDRPFLVFNYLNSDFIKQTNKLKEFIQTIFDFSPNCKIAFTTNFVPEVQSFQYIELTSLDIPAVKHYIEKSHEIQSSFTYLEYEKIHRISSGIPLYINKVIEQLQFRPLTDLGDMEFEYSSNENDDNALPKSLINEIKTIHNDETKQGCRRFMLLSILSLLHNGETYERIRRFFPNVPFYPDDITYLLNNKLIETVQINSIFNYNDYELIKIIRVPRVVRDFVSSLLSDDAKLEIYKSACNLYLGKNWRNSIKIIKVKDAEVDLIVNQNLQIAIRFILLFGVEKNDEIEIVRITRISNELINYFSIKGEYKDAISLTEEILLLIKDINLTDIDNLRMQLLIRLGKNLRMSSITERSISILKSICDDENNSLSRKERNSIRLNLAYIYEDQNNKEETLKYANQVKQNENNKDSSNYLTAETIVYSFIEDEVEKNKKLNAIINKAEKLGLKQLKANIILDMCHNSKDESQLKQIDKIIYESKNATYNKIRALLTRASIILNNRSIDKITEVDLLGLNISYSYSFYQRNIILLNQCHKLEWKYWSKQDRFDQLLNLFRYSSFVWRLCGETDQEQNYIDELYKNSDFIEWFKSNKNGINSSYYEQRIFALYRNGIKNNLLINN